MKREDGVGGWVRGRRETGVNADVVWCWWVGRGCFIGGARRDVV